MRKVKFKKWIPAKRMPDPSGFGSVNVPGTNTWDSDFVHEGLFHQWGVQSTEFESGGVTDTVAIIELPDGIVVLVLPFNVKFEHENL